jgi:ABC-type transporter Mla subunit MlaD
MEALRSNMSATSEALEKLPAILTETQSGFSEMTNRFRDLGTELANQLADQMREVNRELAEQQSKSRKEAEEHTLLVASSTTKVTEEMANHLTRFMTAHTTSNEGLSDLIDQIHEVLAANRDVNGVIGSAITGLISASTSLGANTKEMSQSMNSMQTLNDKMLKLSDSLSGITQGLDAAIARQHEAVEDVFSQARGALVDQLDAYGKINSELGNIKDSYIQSLKVYQDSVNQAVNSNLEVFATKLASVAEGLTAAYTALQETVVEMEGLFAKNSKT